MLRFGKCVDLLYASLKTIHNPNVTLRLTLTLSKLSQALFLYADHIVWLARSGLFKDVNVTAWNERANKYWLLSIVMNLCRDVYELCKIIEQTQIGRADVKRTLVSACSVRNGQELMAASLRTYASLIAHRAVVVDTVKNVCDLFIPLTGLGYTRLSPRTIGVLGVISSVAGLIAVVQPTAKMVPS